jgi:hypothetical protein
MQQVMKERRGGTTTVGRKPPFYRCAPTTVFWHGGRFQSPLAGPTYKLLPPLPMAVVATSHLPQVVDQPAVCDDGFLLLPLLATAAGANCLCKQRRAVVYFWKFIIPLEKNIKIFQRNSPRPTSDCGGNSATATGHPRAATSRPGTPAGRVWHRAGGTKLCRGVGRLVPVKRQQLDQKNRHTVLHQL